MRLKALQTAIVALAVLGMSGPALGQRLQPPTPPIGGEEPIIAIYLAVMLILVLLTIGVNLLPSKRGHQD